MRNLVATLLLLLPLAAAADAIGPLLQQVDYLGADYPGAVRDGQVTNAAEYAEMREFARNIVLQTRVLKNPDLERQAQTLQSLVERKAEPLEVRKVSEALHASIIARFGIHETPAQPPDLALGQRLYAEHCAGCHGAGGYGDGPLSRGMAPAPANFHDLERFATRKPYSLYATIGLGVSGTAMPGFSQLSDHERWSLATVVGGFSTATPTARARALLTQALGAYTAGDSAQAYRLALAAYLDGFELAESALSAVDAPLMREIETQMMALRTAMQNGVDDAKVQAQARALDEKMALAQERLGSRKLTGMGAAFAAFLILLREGLEAILVVAALAAYLVKTGQRAGLPYLHAGWAGALLVGATTWWISENVFTIGGAQREFAEGAAALIAALVMFSVGFWMHSRASAAQWQKFIQTSVKQALGRGTLWGLAGLSFIAVYRECFETVLFYQALWAQTDAGAQDAVVGGFLSAAGLLAVLAWAIMKYSVRLPLREFFAATGILLFLLAVVFAGKGVVALQEAGWIGVFSVPAPRIEILGIYPNAQSLGAQLTLALLAAFLIWKGRTPAKA